ncbi:MAG: hypothetical protein IJM81_08540 [Prevotella sp.]|nr:hypothetical protein [Prevotella sp.]
MDNQIKATYKKPTIEVIQMGHLCDYVDTSDYTEFGGAKEMFDDEAMLDDEEVMN